jgi:hypothetical protein
LIPRPPSPLDAFLAPAQTILVARGPGVVADDVSALGRFAARAVDVDLSDGPSVPADFHTSPEKQQPDAVVVVVVDRVALRLAAGAAQHLPASRRVVCVLLELGGQPPVLVPSPAWPQLVSLQVDTARGAQVMVEFADRAHAGQVVAELARRTSPRHLMSPGWPVLGARSSEPHRWPPGDALAVVDHDESVHDVSGDYPADLLLVDVGRDDTVDPAGPHPVTGRVQVEQRLGAPMTWGEYDTLPVAEALARLTASGVAGLGPVDEQLVNPVGFVRGPVVPVGELRPVPSAPHLLHVEGGPETIIDTLRGPGDATVARLRPKTGIALTWEGGAGPHAYARTVASLAMAGVPLIADSVPPWARALLDPTLADLLETKPDLDDVLEREVHSIRLRRAALGTHGALPWRRGLAARAGERTPTTRVSVLLATRRPELLERALRQVARQRGAEVELVLAAHGFEPDADVLRRFTDESGVSTQVVEGPSSYTFGRLLNAAAERATGDVLLKMDDDDWYGPDFVSDLLLARGYSGADVVGCPPEFMFVEPLWVTVRRRDATEQYRPVVAGGTMMVSREAFGAVGGFRDTRKYVDANLFRALRAAGGTVYRSHGLNYLLRRRSGGHTWEPGLGYFVSRARSWQQWRGFRPSPLQEDDPTDRPVRTTCEGSPR